MIHESSNYVDIQYTAVFILIRGRGGGWGARLLDFAYATPLSNRSKKKLKSEQLTHLLIGLLIDNIHAE